jgi:hypothetical protein
MKVLATILVLIVSPLLSASWSETETVAIGLEACVSYRAKLAGGYLIVEATPQDGWHTFAMDNELRSTEALAGKMSLGIDGPTEISVSGGAKVAAGWLQSEPEDYSKPELRWYSWGYGQPAIFAAKVEGGGPAVVAVRGQTCSEDKCKNVEIELAVPASGDSFKPDLSGLVPVRTR